MVSNKVVAQPGVADGAVVAFDVGILLRLARLDVLDPDAFTFGPGQ
jgi:energy-converting hydrogenase Eha subunit B